MAAQESARFLGTTSLAVASGAGASTAVFGSQTYQIRVANDGTTPVRFLVGDGPSVSSTVINTTGALLPATGVEYIQVAPGQRISFGTTGTASAGGVTVTECGV